MYVRAHLEPNHWPFGIDFSRSPSCCDKPKKYSQDLRLTWSVDAYDGGADDEPAGRNSSRNGMTKHASCFLILILPVPSPVYTGLGLCGPEGLGGSAFSLPPRFLRVHVI